ncbi:signal peptide peptidase SppA [Compostibacter hankyongensis]|uniref:Signal peptide peptidase SppA n=2 Tax=Compostibacter hankyongensis TaxID=1007089 RepID=A0ABP8FRJ7_9BACT
MFLAALLAFVVLCVIVFFILTAVVGGMVNPSEEITLRQNTILTVDLSEPLMEQKRIDPLNAVLQQTSITANGLHDVVTLIGKAASDDHIKGIYLKLGENPNGWGTTEALRKALLDFKQSGKFIYAYGDIIDQPAYYIAVMADKIFLNPQGMLDFRGFSMQTIYVKGALDRLEIQPQVFYNGKFKSATEPLRLTRMSDENRLQASAYLGDLYAHFLEGIAWRRNVDTATLFRYANEGMIRNAGDALRYKLVDGLKYHDEVMSALRERVGFSPSERLRFVSLTRYEQAVGNTAASGAADQKVAVLYAQGDIITGDGKGDGEDVRIASEKYIHLIHKLWSDSSVKAVVLRVNSPGGSALAADEIWRELQLVKKDKPVVVSMGDYAASGGYYISCMADSIFAEPNTLTGSIGVFGIVPNLQTFFNDKLGVTFDGVKTAQYADAGTMSRPLTEAEKQFIQQSIDSVYATFKHRVADGRHLPESVVDSIAQGRVWSGRAAQRIGLVDRLGGLNDAIACAARMAGISGYSLHEYPETNTSLQQLLRRVSGSRKTIMLKEALGSDNYRIFQQLETATRSSGGIQARLPYTIIIR